MKIRSQRQFQKALLGILKRLLIIPQDQPDNVGLLILYGSAIVLSVAITILVAL
jgi:hypothetical protein